MVNYRRAKADNLLASYFVEKDGEQPREETLDGLSPEAARAEVRPPAGARRGSLGSFPPSTRRGFYEFALITGDQRPQASETCRAKIGSLWTFKTWEALYAAGSEQMRSRVVNQGHRHIGSVLRGASRISLGSTAVSWKAL